MKTYFAVTGVVQYKDKILILKRPENERNYPGKWSLCSGFVKEFESGEENVLREIKEETGLDAEITGEGKLVTNKDPESNKQFRTGINPCFRQHL